MRLHSPTTTAVTFTDGIITFQHGILEKGMIHTPTRILLQYLDGFVSGNPARFIGVMFVNKTGKWLTNDQTYIHLCTVLCFTRSTGAIQVHQMIRIFQNNSTRFGIWNHVFQIWFIDRFLNHNQLTDRVQWHCLPMVAICDGITGQINAMLVTTTLFG